MERFNYDWRQSKKDAQILLSTRLSDPNIKRDVLKNKVSKLFSSMDLHLKSYRKNVYNKHNLYSVDRLKANSLIDLKEEIKKSVQESEFNIYAERLLDALSSNLMPHQFAFINNPAAVTMAEWPRGLGKSYIAHVCLLIRALSEPGIRGIVYNKKEATVRKVNFIASGTNEGSSMESLILKYIGKRGYNAIVAKRRDNHGEMYFEFSNGSMIEFYSSEGAKPRGDKYDVALFDEFWYYIEYLNDILGAIVPAFRAVKVGAPLKLYFTSTVDLDSNTAQYENSYPAMVKKGFSFIKKIIRDEAVRNGATADQMEIIMDDIQFHGRSRLLNEIMKKDMNQWLSTKKIHNSTDDDTPTCAYGFNHFLAFNYLSNSVRGRKVENPFAWTDETDQFTRIGMPRENYLLERKGEAPEQKHYPLWTPEILKASTMYIKNYTFMEYVIDLARTPGNYIVLAIDPSGWSQDEKRKGKSKLGALLVCYRPYNSDMLILRDYTLNHVDTSNMTPLVELDNVINNMLDVDNIDEFNSNVFSRVKLNSGIENDIIQKIAIETYGAIQVLASRILNHPELQHLDLVRNQQGVVTVAHKKNKKRTEIDGKLRRINDLMYFYDLGKIKHCVFADESVDNYNLMGLEKNMLLYSNDKKIRAQKIQHLDYQIDNLDAITVAVSYTYREDAILLDPELKNLFSFEQKDRYGRIMRNDYE